MQFVFLIVPVIGAVIIGVLVFLALRFKKRARLIEDTPFCNANKLPSGPAKMEGEVVALEDTITSPMTQEECVYFHFKVEEQRTRTVTETVGAGASRRTRTRTETYWATIVDDVQHVACGVKDKTGTAEVELGDAEVVLTSANRQQSGTMNSCPKDLQRTLKQQYGTSTKGLLFNKTLRYTESLICEGDDLFVLGVVEKKKGQTPRFTKTREHPLIVSDKEEAELIQHYKRNALYCWIGVAVTAVVIAIGTYVAFTATR